MKLIIGGLAAVLLGMVFLILKEGELKDRAAFEAIVAEEEVEHSLAASTRKIEAEKAAQAAKIEREKMMAEAEAASDELRATLEKHVGKEEADRVFEKAAREYREKRMLELQEEEVRLLREK